MQPLEFDFLVIGSGIAGLTFALKCATRGRVLVVTKSEISDTNTSWAQGGVAAAVGEGDSWRLHEEDTLIAGAGLCDPKAVRYLVQNARPCLDWLISMGARFDQESGNGLPQLDLGLEGGHSRHRIVHHADQSGWEIERALSVAVRGVSDISFLEHTFCEGLALTNGRCTGAFLLPQGGERIVVRARATILATGSCCRAYRFTTNPPIATGDGIGLASAAGAHISNMEFIQFHPTTLYHRDARNFLITEAVRGQGGILRNLHGRRFMFDYDERGDLAPRDIVARAIHAETLNEGVPFVHLDMTHLDPAATARHFPKILETLAAYGIDPTRDPIPVVPAAHYQCGGIVTNLDGQTSVPGLYAAGEVACTGVHGANRLASNSLLEALVFGSGAADAAIAEPDAAVGAAEIALLPVSMMPKRSTEGIVRRLRRLMWERVGIVRSHSGLAIAKQEVEDLREESSTRGPFHVGGAEAANMLECARLIIGAAIERKTNVGLHYNRDLGQAQGAQGSRAGD